MLGQTAKIFRVHPGLTADDLVPPDNFYRQEDMIFIVTIGFIRAVHASPSVLSGSSV